MVGNKSGFMGLYLGIWGYPHKIIREQNSTVIVIFLPSTEKCRYCFHGQVAARSRRDTGIDCVGLYSEPEKAPETSALEKHCGATLDFV
jgi:hypothetical protein